MLYTENGGFGFLRFGATVHLFMDLLTTKDYAAVSYATTEVDTFGNEYEKTGMEMSDIPASLLLIGLESGKINSYNFTIQLVINDFDPESFADDSTDQTDGTMD